MLYIWPMQATPSETRDPQHALASASFNSAHLLQFIFLKRKVFALVGVAAALLSAGASLLIEEKFQSTVILFATPQHSIGEQFFEELKQKDLLEYGETEDAERLLQILNSDQIRSRIIRKYDLWKHYQIDSAGAGARADLAKQYDSQVDANLTKFGSIEIRVMDKDPLVAADIANDIAFLADSLANRLRNDRAKEALRYATASYQQVKDEINDMETELAALHALGIYDFETQIGGLNEQYATAMAVGAKNNAEIIRQQMADLSKNATEFNKLTNLIEGAYEREKILKRRFELMKLDAETQIASAFVVDRAAAADKKAYPIRWLIVAVSVTSSLLFALLALLAADSLQSTKSAA